MTSSITVELPRLMWEIELSSELRRKNIVGEEGINIPTSVVEFNWRQVRFFEDMALLKLLMIEYNLRPHQRVIHTGIEYNPQLQGVLRQLFHCGYLELMASAQLWNPSREIAEDIAELLTYTPSTNLHPEKKPNVMRIVACHGDSHFMRGSREARRITEFVEHRHRTEFIAATEAANSSVYADWDIIATGAFRNLIIEQTRRNVLEHAGASLGLSCARIISKDTFLNEWGRRPKDTILEEVLASDNPMAMRLKDEFAHGNAVIHTTAIDNGKGIPKALARYNGKDFLTELLNESKKEEFRECQESSLLYPTKIYFHHRFDNATAGWGKSHKLLALATDPKGTHKLRYNWSEKKGITTLVENYVMERSGCIRIESGKNCLVVDSLAINKKDVKQHMSFSSEGDYRYYGEPTTTDLLWMPATEGKRNKDGTAVALTTRIVSINSSGRARIGSRPVSSATIIQRANKNVRYVSVYEVWEANQGPQCIAKVADVLKKETIREANLHELCIFDWSKMKPASRKKSNERIDKGVLNSILYEFAKAISDLPTEQMASIVFVHFPSEMSHLLSEALNGFPELKPRLDLPPIAFFTLGSRELDWIWLNCPPDMQDFVISQFNSLLAPHLYIKYPTVKPLHGEWQAEAHRLLGRCPLFYSSTIKDPSGDTRSVFDFKPYFTLDQITSCIQELFTDKLKSLIENDPEIAFKDEDGIVLPPDCIVNKYYRCDALVDSEIADELAEELTNIVYGFAAETLEGKIDYLVSCTSPTHWFVHKIIDGLREYGMHVGHYVFAAKSSIKTEIENVGIHPGHNVVVFTDVISSGDLVDTIGHYIRKVRANLSGLVAIIDTRDRDMEVDFNARYGGKVQLLVSLPVIKKTIKKEDRGTYQKAKWIKDGDTAAIRLRKESGEKERDEYYNSIVYAGIGELRKYHGFWRDPATVLRHLGATKAIRVGHFQHSNHHSIVYCDIRRAFGDVFLKESYVSALYQYIIINKIQLVLRQN